VERNVVVSGRVSKRQILYSPAAGEDACSFPISSAGSLLNILYLVFWTLRLLSLFPGVSALDLENTVHAYSNDS